MFWVFKRRRKERKGGPTASRRQARLGVRRERVCWHLPAFLVERIREEAARQGKSQTMLVIELLTEGLTKRES